jgi:hypothetical protein
LASVRFASSHAVQQRNDLLGCRFALRPTRGKVEQPALLRREVLVFDDVVQARWPSATDFGKLPSAISW